MHQIHPKFSPPLIVSSHQNSLVLFILILIFSLYFLLHYHQFPMASFSPPLSSTLPTSLNKVHFSRRSWLCLLQKRNQSLFLVRSTENGAGNGSSIVTEEKRESSPVTTAEKKEVLEKKVESLGLNGAASVKAEVPSFKDERWVGGTWDLKQFQKGGKTDLDAVIDAEVRRRKWLQDNPEASSNDEPVVFDTSIIPWWQWIKRFHLPEAEILNGL